MSTCVPDSWAAGWARQSEDSPWGGRGRWLWTTCVDWGGFTRGCLEEVEKHTFRVTFHRA